MPRWHDELAEVGWTVPELVASVERAGREAVAGARPVGAGDHPADGRGPLPRGSPVGGQGVHRRRCRRGGRPGALRPARRDLDRVVQRVLAVPDCVPLLGVTRRPGTDLRHRRGAGHRSGRRRTGRPGHRHATSAAVVPGESRGGGHRPGRARPRPSADVRAGQGGPGHLRRRTADLAGARRRRRRQDHRHPLRRRRLHRRRLRGRRHGHLRAGRPHPRPGSRPGRQPDGRLAAVAPRPRHPRAHPLGTWSCSTRPA